MTEKLMTTESEARKKEKQRKQAGAGGAGAALGDASGTGAQTSTATKVARGLGAGVAPLLSAGSKVSEGLQEANAFIGRGLGFPANAVRAGIPLANEFANAATGGAPLEAPAQVNLTQASPVEVQGLGEIPTLSPIAPPTQDVVPVVKAAPESQEITDMSKLGGGFVTSQGMSQQEISSTLARRDADETRQRYAQERQAASSDLRSAAYNQMQNLDNLSRTKGADLGAITTAKNKLLQDVAAANAAIDDKYSQQLDTLGAPTMKPSDQIAAQRLQFDRESFVATQAATKQKADADRMAGMNKEQAANYLQVSGKLDDMYSKYVDNVYKAASATLTPAQPKTQAQWIAENLAPDTAMKDLYATQQLLPFLEGKAKENLEKRLQAIAQLGQGVQQ